MELSQRILSDMAVHMKYARYMEEEVRRENWGEIVDRSKQMHIKRWPQHEEYLNEIFKPVHSKQVLPSMRCLQFGGLPIERNPTRIYNCAYLPVEHSDAFSEVMFLLLGGTGVGYSVQTRHIEKLPAVQGTNGKRRRYKVGDSIEGWADAIKVLVESYFKGKHEIDFDYSDVRKKGSLLVVTGGKAPGPGPLRVAIAAITAILNNAKGRKLTPIEAHDILCHIADAVLSGGIRRAAMLSLFSPSDWEMMKAKSGHWWENNAQRGRANNSVALLRGKTSKKDFLKVWKAVEASGAGEPGIYWTNNLDWGTNPCAEIALKPYQFCNLVEINGSVVSDQETLDRMSIVASSLATFQAAYTDFHYLRPIWKETTEEEALIGAGITGIANENLLALDFAQSAKVVKDTNHAIATLLDINPSARCTTVKPSGTASIVLGCSSGIHAWHNDYYLRRMRVNKDEAIYKYLRRAIPQYTEDSFANPEGEAILSIPQKAPDGAILRTETPFQLFNRVLRLNKDWVREGHRSGDNYNNVSATISLKPEEWEGFGEMMWLHREDYNGISVLPFDGGTYLQAPFEDITEDQYKVSSLSLRAINLDKVHEDADYTDLTGEAACSGGACEVV